MESALGKFMIGWEKDFFTCDFIFTFQSDRCVEPTCPAKCFIHFVISHRSENIQLMLPLSTEIYACWIFFLPIFIYLFIYLFILLVSGLEIFCKLEEISVILHGRMSRVFTNVLGDQDSIPGRVIPKTQKMVLDAALLNAQHYKVQIKGKVEQSRERSSALPYSLML